MTNIVRKTMCATCPFRKGSGTEYLRATIEASAITNGRLCHSTGNNPIIKAVDVPEAVCRGAREFQKEMLHGIGFLKGTTDKEWAAKRAERGFPPERIADDKPGDAIPEREPQPARLPRSKVVWVLGYIDGNDSVHSAQVGAAVVHGDIWPVPRPRAWRYSVAEKRLVGLRADDGSDAYKPTEEEVCWIENHLRKIGFKIKEGVCKP